MRAIFLRSFIPRTRAAVRLSIREALRPGGQFEAEYWMQRPERSASLGAEPGADHCNSAGQPFRMSGLTLEVTERRQAAEELRLSEERFRLLA
jgi:PAS domain-containing protein